MSQASCSPPLTHIALVTGATGAIGKAIARQIAAAPGYAVTLVARDETRARRAVDEITRATGNVNVHYALADLSRQTSIQALAARWQGALHLLVNNAAASPRARLETPEGIEMQFATNVLGYFWMTLAFEEILKQSAPARIINVASYWAGDLDLDDLEFRHRSYHNGIAYRQSKQANRMLSVAFAGRLKPHGITVNACHPGDVNSKLSNDLGFGGHETPEQGADTPAWLALSAIGGSETGRYFEGRRAVRDRFVEDHIADDREAVGELYNICMQYSKNY
jgi:NAD(P)-dependent dehydrogenase (short-subunit alcohol dehydrogenase family)